MIKQTNKNYILSKKFQEHIVYTTTISLVKADPLYICILYHVSANLPQTQGFHSHRPIPKLLTLNKPHWYLRMEVSCFFLSHKTWNCLRTIGNVFFTYYFFVIIIYYHYFNSILKLHLPIKVEEVTANLFLKLRKETSYVLFNIFNFIHYWMNS